MVTLLFRLEFVKWSLLLRNWHRQQTSLKYRCDFFQIIIKSNKLQHDIFSAEQVQLFLKCQMFIKWMVNINIGWAPASLEFGRHGYLMNISIQKHQKHEPLLCLVLKWRRMLVALLKSQHAVFNRNDSFTSLSADILIWEGRKQFMILLVTVWCPSACIHNWPLWVGGGPPMVSVRERGLSPLSLTAPSSCADSESEGSISPRSRARSCSEKERSLFKGMGELSALLSSLASGDSSSCEGTEGRGQRGKRRRRH